MGKSLGELEGAEVGRVGAFVGEFDGASEGAAGAKSEHRNGEKKGKKTKLLVISDAEQSPTQSHE